MPRRRSTSNFFPGISSFSHGSNVNNLGLIQQNVELVNASGHDNHTSVGWTGQSSSSGSSRNQVALEELNGDHGQLPTPAASTGISQSLLEESHPEPNGDETLSTGPVTLGPSIVQSAISDAIPQNLDLNVPYEDRNGNIHVEVWENSSLVGNTEIFERNTRRRITPANEQGFLPSSMSSLVRVDNTYPTLQPSYCNWVTSPSSGSVSSIYPVVLASGSAGLREEENLQYNPRSTSVHSMLVPGTERGNPSQNPVTVRNSPRNHSSQNGFAGVQLSAPTGSSQYNVPLLVPGTEMGNPGQNPITVRNSRRNHSSQNGFAGVQLSAPPGVRQHYVTGAFQNGFTTGIHPASTPAGFPRRTMAEEYAERLSNIVNHSRIRVASSGSQGQTTYHPPPSVRGRLESGVGNVRAFQALPRPGVSTIRDEGRNAAVPPMPPLLQPSVDVQLRARLVLRAREILRWLDAGILQYVDGMFVHGPLFYEAPDVHENMRLDVDNMSYEELLALEEQIGNVSTGLSEEAILAGTRRLTYQSMKLGPPVEEGPCCICQDDYVDGQELGKLDCGHDFHFNCIKQWLKQKNTCPICKSPAVAI